MQKRITIPISEGVRFDLTRKEFEAIAKASRTAGVSVGGMLYAKILWACALPPPRNLSPKSVTHISATSLWVTIKPSPEDLRAIRLYCEATGAPLLQVVRAAVLSILRPDNSTPKLFD